MDGGEGQKASTPSPQLPKICHTYPTMMKLGTVRPYLKKIQKCINHTTHLLSQHFLTRNQQILPYQEVLI